MNLADLNCTGLLIGVAAFLCIGIFHPIVIKAEYYWSKRCWWLFLLVGLIALVASMLVDGTVLSTLLGVFAFSSFWSIHELMKQEERVKKGWFPKNPNRKYPF